MKIFISKSAVADKDLYEGTLRLLIPVQKHLVLTTGSGTQVKSYLDCDYMIVVPAHQEASDGVTLGYGQYESVKKFVGKHGADRVLVATEAFVSPGKSRIVLNSYRSHIPFTESESNTSTRYSAMRLNNGHAGLERLMAVAKAEEKAQQDYDFEFDFDFDEDEDFTEVVKVEKTKEVKPISGEAPIAYECTSQREFEVVRARLCRMGYDADWERGYVPGSWEYILVNGTLNGQLKYAKAKRDLVTRVDLTSAPYNIKIFHCVDTFFKNVHCYKGNPGLMGIPSEVVEATPVPDQFTAAITHDLLEDKVDKKYDNVIDAYYDGKIHRDFADYVNSVSAAPISSDVHKSFGPICNAESFNDKGYKLDVKPTDTNTLSLLARRILADNERFKGLIA